MVVQQGAKLGNAGRCQLLHLRINLLWHKTAALVDLRHGVMHSGNNLAPSERADGAARRDLAHTVSAAVCDNDVALAIHGNPVRTVELRRNADAVCKRGPPGPCQNSILLVCRGDDERSGIRVTKCEMHFLLVLTFHVSKEYVTFTFPF